MGCFELKWTVLSDELEELVGLEPTHVGFAIRGITSFAIAPKKIWYFCVFTFIKRVAEDKGFEPSEAFTSPVFKTGTIDQLCQSSTT